MEIVMMTLRLHQDSYTLFTTKTKNMNLFKLSRNFNVFVGVLLAFVGFVACSDSDTDYQDTNPDSNKAVVSSVQMIGADGKWKAVTQARVGDVVRLEGNNLEAATSVFFNGKEVVKDDFETIEKTYIELAIPTDTPVGTVVADEKNRNTVRVVTSENEFTIEFNILSTAMEITAIHSYENGAAGATITEVIVGTSILIKGKELNSAVKVYFNGVATETFDKVTDGLTVTIPAETPLTGVATTDLNKVKVENESGEKVEYALTIKAEPAAQPTLTEVKKDGATVSEATVGDKIQLYGTNLSTITDLTFGTTDILTREFKGTDAEGYLEFEIPTGATGTKNFIVTTSGGVATLSFTVKDTFVPSTDAPMIDVVSHTLARAGEKIRLLGSNLNGTTKVTFPGGVEATAFTVESATSLTVVVPTGGDQTAGAISVTNAAGTGYSYSYVNCRNNLIVEKFKDDKWGIHVSSDKISANLSDEVGVTGEWPKNPAFYRAFPADATVDYTATSADDGKYGSESFSNAKVWERVATMDGFSSTTPCNDLALQVDCWMTSSVWKGAGIRLGFSSDREITFIPWHANYTYWNTHKAYDTDFSEGWKTLTFPLSEVASTQGLTVGDSPAGAKNGSIRFIFGNLTLPDGSGYSRGAAMDGFRFYFGNIRIVPYTKPSQQ